MPVWIRGNVETSVLRGLSIENYLLLPKKKRTKCLYLDRFLTISHFQPLEPALKLTIGPKFWLAEDRIRHSRGCSGVLTYQATCTAAVARRSRPQDRVCIGFNLCVKNQGYCKQFAVYYLYTYFQDSSRNT